MLYIARWHLAGGPQIWCRSPSTCPPSNQKLRAAPSTHRSVQSDKSEVCYSMLESKSEQSHVTCTWNRASRIVNHRCRNRFRCFGTNRTDIFYKKAACANCIWCVCVCGGGGIAVAMPTINFLFPTLLSTIVERRQRVE